jgi:hypothetical protein
MQLSLAGVELENRFTPKLMCLGGERGRKFDGDVRQSIVWYKIINFTTCHTLRKLLQGEGNPKDTRSLLVSKREL